MYVLLGTYVFMDVMICAMSIVSLGRALGSLTVSAAEYMTTHGVSSSEQVTLDPDTVPEQGPSHRTDVVWNFEVCHVRWCDVCMLCMYVCLYAMYAICMLCMLCMDGWLAACMYICMYAIYVWMYGWMYVYMYVYMYGCMYDMYVWMDVCMYAMYVCYMCAVCMSCMYGCMSSPAD